MAQIEEDLPEELKWNRSVKTSKKEVRAIREDQLDAIEEDLSSDDDLFNSLNTIPSDTKKVS